MKVCGMLGSWAAERAGRPKRGRRPFRGDGGAGGGRVGVRRGLDGSVRWCESWVRFRRVMRKAERSEAELAEDERQRGRSQLRITPLKANPSGRRGGVRDPRGSAACVCIALQEEERRETGGEAAHHLRDWPRLPSIGAARSRTALRELGTQCTTGDSKPGKRRERLEARRRSFTAAARR